MSASENITNPFGVSTDVKQKPAGALATTDQQRAIAEVQAAMMLARMNQRNERQAMDRILNACTRPSLAENAVYNFSRGGTDISGPSIRLAETMAQSWGNLFYGVREIEQTDDESTVQAFCWDLETNTRREMTFQVPHVRFKKGGKSTKLEDPRDVYENVANMGARRLRACILAIIPGDVSEAAVNQCDVTMKSSADTSPDAMQKMLDAFKKMGVSKEQIEKRIQRRVEAIRPAQVVSLRKIYTSINDGMSVAADWFEAEGQSGTISEINEAAKGKASEKKGEEKPSTATSDNEGPLNAAGTEKNTDSSGNAVPPGILKAMEAITAMVTTDEIDKWLFNNHKKLIKDHGERWYGFLSLHADDRRRFINAEPPNGQGPKPIVTERTGIAMVKCPEAGGREIPASDCETGSCKDDCEAFKASSGGSKLTFGDGL